MTKIQKYLSYTVIACVSMGFMVGTSFADFPDFPRNFRPIIMAHENHVAVCSDGGPEVAHCHARVMVDTSGKPRTAALPSGYGPIQFVKAYANGINTKSQKIIGIVDAYNDPNILADLKTYSTTYGIPQLPACRGPIAASTGPCFQKVDQRGGTRYPSTNPLWALEISLDVEAAHAMCHTCRILLVEADSATFSDLLAAEDRAATLGATAISNSWGANEFSAETSVEYDGHFNKPGVAITVSSGDSGYGTEYPAASQYVTAVGGTSLSFNDAGSYQGETAWYGAGSGCSLYEPIPNWQKGVSNALCPNNRMIADVSADADPNTGAAVYDSAGYYGMSGWFQVGGTSLSSPLIAAIYASSGTTESPASPYTHGNAYNLHDVVSGSNGYCDSSYLCTSTVGYDGPTGLGSPRGFTAF